MYSNEQIDASLLQYYNSDDSMLQINGVLGQSSFRKLAKQLKMQGERRQELVHKFYSTEDKPKQHQMNYSPYYCEFLEWKNKKEEGRNGNRFLIQKSQTQLDSQLQKEIRQSYLQLLRAQYRNKKDDYLYQQSKNKMGKISRDYEEKMKQLLKKQEFRKKEIQEKERLSTLEIHHIQYPTLFNENKLKQSLKQSNLLKKSQKSQLNQIPHTSYQNIIKNPPKKPSQIFENKMDLLPPVDSPESDEEEEQSVPQEKQKLRWTLNVDQILKIPHHQFLIFYNQYENKIRTLLSVEQFKKVKRYREQCLEKEKAIYKLRQKVAMSDKKVIEKLSPERKNKLFELLYEDELDQEIQNQSKFISRQNFNQNKRY